MDVTYDMILIDHFDKIPLGGVVFKKTVEDKENKFSSMKYSDRNDQSFIDHCLELIKEKRLYRRISKPWFGFS